MPRTARVAPAGLVYHVLNRAVGKMHLLRKHADLEAFQRVMIEAHGRHPVRILSYCVLSNHWHFVIWPEEEGQLTAFFRWLTHTHAMRWRVAHRTVGYGPLYREGEGDILIVLRDPGSLGTLSRVLRVAFLPSIRIPRSGHETGMQ